MRIHTHTHNMYIHMYVLSDYQPVTYFSKSVILFVPIL